MNNTVIEPEVAAWFETRGIQDEVLDYAGISSKRYSENELWVTFPRYNSNDDIAKSRMGTLKNNKLENIVTLEGEDIFYNEKALDLAILEQKPLVICQSEMDCLAALQSGHAWSIAYIDGNDLLWENQEKLKQVPIILAGFDSEIGKEFNDIISKQVGLSLIHI